jgi:hypothetical protein
MGSAVMQLGDSNQRFLLLDERVMVLTVVCFRKGAFAVVAARVLGGSGDCESGTKGLGERAGAQ